jgi:hypothetical protein
MPSRRGILAGSICTALAACASGPRPRQSAADIDSLGKFELVLGRPGIVVGMPHATADTGTLDVGRILRERLGAGSVVVTGFWDGATRQRINVNRPTEQIIGHDSEVVRQWRSDRAAVANERYVALVKEAAQGRLTTFFEIHSNHKPNLADSIEVSALGFTRADAARLKAAFASALERLAPDVPRLAIHVSPLDRVTYPDYGAASTVSKVSERGCAIEGPGRVLANRAWRLAYGACLADAIHEARWG